ncbi:hypothetical protein [Thermomonas fusca]|jgi:hypothetical protein
MTAQIMDLRLQRRCIGSIRFANAAHSIAGPSSGSCERRLGQPSVAGYAPRRALWIEFKKRLSGAPVSCAMPDWVNLTRCFAVCALRRIR